MGDAKFGTEWELTHQRKLMAEQVGDDSQQNLNMNSSVVVDDTRFPNEKRCES